MEYCIHDSGDADAHHLIYREELKKDGEKKVLCSGCSKPIWGSLHNCIECGNRPVHGNPSSKNHCLDFTEKLENDGNKQVVCFGCNDPVLMGPAYKCSVSKCSFVIHKSCAELYQEINHPLHPDHNLSLRFGRNQCCDACCRSHDRSFIYYCGSCDFQLDIKCANRLPNNPNDCHDYYCEEHHLIYREELKKDGEKKVLCSWRQCQEPIWGSLHNCIECGNRPVHRYSSNNHCLDFTEKLKNDGNKEVVCLVCEEPVLGAAYKCSVSECSSVIHKSCAELSQEINHPLHPGHTLSLRFWRNQRCDACCRSHDRYSFFYCCRSCSFKLDIKCASYRLPINPNDCPQHEFFAIWKRIQFNCEACGEEFTNLAYKVCSICKLLVHYRCAEIPRTVKIELHNHFLNLIYSNHEIKKCDDMFCRYCGDKVNTEYAAYYCQKCSYILHTECLRSFQDKYGESPATSDQSVPNKFVGHATHLIKALNQAEDEGPHLGEIQHFSHQQHKLILCNDEVKDDKLCEGCMEFIISIPFYSCAPCKFFLHTRCAELPTRIERHRLHKSHTLTLLPRAPNKSGVSFCHICSRHHRGFTYKCDECFWTGQLDVQCGSIPETFKHEGHQHLFYLALNSKNRECKVCAEDNTDHVFVCTGCDFILGIRCANLSLVAKHKYDTHPLKLTYAAEHNSGEYYCLICEKERDKNHWFYYCEKCNFPAHPECVIGNYPFMMIGSTYTSEYHPHPLTFVQKTRDSPRCIACGSRFDDVALECRECKFSVHPPRPFFPDCLWILREREREPY